MKIAVYGCGYGAECISNSNKRGIEFDIVYYVLTNKTMDTYMGVPVRTIEDIEWEEIDYLVVSSIIYAKDILNELESRSLQYNKNKRKVIMRHDFLSLFCNVEQEYRVVTVKEGCSYVYSKKDMEIGPTMGSTGENYSRSEIDRAMHLSNRKKNGYYLDIGANIGTTSIYIKKNYPDLKVIAFEPGSENNRMLKINCILNCVEDICVEKIGLGVRDEERSYHYVEDNPGGSAVCDDVTNMDSATETVKIESLDSYLERHKIDNSDISFIWIDTEGFESEVIIGAEKTLRGNHIPLVQEFNPTYYIRRELKINITKL